MSVLDGLRSVVRPSPRNETVLTERIFAAPTGTAYDGSADAARKLSAVDRCIEILSDSIGKLPNYILDSSTNERVKDHPVLRLLNTRPNEAMSPFVRKKMLETSRLEGGNAYEWIIRDPKTAEPVELIPIPWQLVEPWMDTGGHVWYTVRHPYTGEPMTLPSADVCHYKCAARNGLKGISVLQRASEVVAAGRAAQQYDRSYYESGGQPSGVLQTETDLGGTVPDPSNPGKEIGKKDLLRREWERVHAGPSNSHRIAILDYGLNYKPLSASNRDAQFVENKEVTVKDIARFFGMPLYKLQEGKQAYGSNEQNAVEYVVETLHPNVLVYEEEQTWKLLFESDIRKSLRIRINLMAELRGDTTSRGNWYRTMREIGVFSPNDVCALEDLPNVPGGDTRRESLNYVPLEDWQELSRSRNGGCLKK